MDPTEDRPSYPFDKPLKNFLDHPDNPLLVEVGSSLQFLKSVQIDTVRLIDDIIFLIISYLDCTESTDDLMQDPLQLRHVTSSTALINIQSHDNESAFIIVPPTNIPAPIVVPSQLDYIGNDHDKNNSNINPEYYTFEYVLSSFSFFVTLFDEALETEKVALNLKIQELDTDYCRNMLDRDKTLRLKGVVMHMNSTYDNEDPKISNSLMLNLNDDINSKDNYNLENEIFTPDKDILYEKKIVIDTLYDNVWEETDDSAKQKELTYRIVAKNINLCLKYGHCYVLFVENQSKLGKCVGFRTVRFNWSEDTFHEKAKFILSCRLVSGFVHIKSRIQYFKPNEAQFYPSVQRISDIDEYNRKREQQQQEINKTSNANDINNGPAQNQSHPDSCWGRCLVL